MALHIFNLSIDAPDAAPDSIPEDLSVNDIESITELILEDVLLIVNAIPESDDQDNDNGCEFEKKVDFFSHKIEIIPQDQALIKFPVLFPFYFDTFLNSQLPEISTPPPQA
ncbi:MAG: hypothetical protein HYU69_06155 [Bacteroidetes bacterium]|nr:hypothetical protein [Bacteroidota bacterium]